MKIFNKIITIVTCAILVFTIISCNKQQTQETPKHICEHVCEICGNCQWNELCYFHDEQ